MPEIHWKDVSKPEKYAGDVMKWKLWSGSMRIWLKTKPKLWPMLLDEVKRQSSKRFTPEGEEAVWTAMGVFNPEVKQQLKEQFHRYLSEFTSGMCHTQVVLSGVNGVLEEYRSLCDKGYCMREGPVMDKLRDLTDNKKKKAAMATVHRAIMTWESNVSEFLEATDKTISKYQMKLCLEELLPDELTKHIFTLNQLKREGEKLDYDNIKTAIDDYLVAGLKWSEVASRTPPKKLAYMGAEEDNQDEGEWPEDEGEWPEEDWDPELYEQYNTCIGHISSLTMSGEQPDVRDSLLALVKGAAFNKKGKGKGGKGKGNTRKGKGKGGKGKDTDVVMTDAQKATAK